MSEHQQLWVFVHIPKNGGSTLWQAFRYMFGGALVRNHRNIHHSPRLNCESVKIYLDTPTYPVRIIGAHFGFMAEYAADYPHFTLLRDPIERQISWYFFVRRQVHQTLNPLLYTDGMTPERGIPLLGDNEQVRYLINVFDRPLTPADLEQAKFNLEHRFAAFGLVERYNESLILFKRTFGWPMPYYAIENKGVNRPKAISEEARRIAAAHNALDIKLYAWACELFARRIAAQPPDFEAELRRFERNLARWQRWVAPVWQRYDHFRQKRLRKHPVYRFLRRAHGKLRLTLDVILPRKA